MSELTTVPVKCSQAVHFNALMNAHYYLGVPFKIGESAFDAEVLLERWVALL